MGMGSWSSTTFSRPGEAPHIEPEHERDYPDSPAVRAAIAQARADGWDGHDVGTARDIGQTPRTETDETYPSWRIMDISRTPEPAAWPPLPSQPKPSSPPAPKPEWRPQPKPEPVSASAQTGKMHRQTQEAICRGCGIVFTSAYYSTGWAQYHSRGCFNANADRSQRKPRSDASAARKPHVQTGKGKPSVKAQDPVKVSASRASASQAVMPESLVVPASAPPSAPAPAPVSVPAGGRSARRQLGISLHQLVDALPDDEWTMAERSRWLEAVWAVVCFAITTTDEPLPLPASFEIERADRDREWRLSKAQ
jgi:hypothetical protein